MQETIKVVASTNVWKDFGESADFPMWKSVGCNEYIICLLYTSDAAD